MNGASKILTVSYGTFSCTLEGFDDPFNTMRAIAEYFRDLAADDRYFGAEPPTPDAAMLHKIAEREIQRRVEAKIGENGVTLRAEEAAPPRVTMPAVQPSVPAPVRAPGLAPSLASLAEAAPAAESAAARLSRLRAAQTQILAPLAVSVVMGDISSRFADVEAYAEDQDADAAFKPAPITLSEPPAETAAVVVTEAPVAKPAPVVIEVAVPPVAETVVQADAPEDDAPEVDATMAEPVLDSLRETLAGLIGQDDQLAEDMASASAEAPVLLTSDDALPEDAAEVEVEDLAARAGFDTPSEAFDQSDLEDLAALDGQSPIIDDAAYVEAEPEADADDQPVETTSAPHIAVSPGAPVAAKIHRARARVIKIRRLDKVAGSDPEQAPTEPAAATLSPEEEADLQNTLAALEAEIAPVPAELPPEPTVVLTAEPAPEADTVDAQPDVDAAAIDPAPVEAPKTLVAADDAAVDRLLAQTNSQLEVPETKRRRSAIAHLKAAVLATVADRRSNPKGQANVAEVKMDPYRKDLDQAVRPSPTLVPGERPAPLVLVSAQRIDRKRDAVADANRPMPQIVASVSAPQSGSAKSVRPRRVTSGGQAQAVSSQSLDEDDSDLAPEASGNIFAAGPKQSFAEFADSLGAGSLAELIEAAGAYCTLVLDRPSFSRPLLFQQISTLPQVAAMTPEDSLRSFGKLLRDGRIQKTVRGQFALSEASPILTEAKRIAG